MKVRFAHLSDIHFGGENKAAVAAAGDRIRAGGFDLTIVSGDLTQFAEEVRNDFDRVVLCGMGGSSLAPEVFWRLAETFASTPGRSAPNWARRFCHHE